MLFGSKEPIRHKICFQENATEILTVHGCVVPRVGERVRIHQERYAVTEVGYGFYDPEEEKYETYKLKTSLEMFVYISLKKIEPW